MTNIGRTLTFAREDEIRTYYVAVDDESVWGFDVTYIDEDEPPFLEHILLPPGWAEVSSAETPRPFLRYLIAICQPTARKLILAAFQAGRVLRALKCN